MQQARLAAGDGDFEPDGGFEPDQDWLQVMAISNLIAKEFGGTRDLSGIGGVETGSDAAEFLLLGANSVQASSTCHMQSAPS